MAEKKNDKCAHPGCECPVAKGSKYCGSYCEGAGNSPSIACIVDMRNVRSEKPWAQPADSKACRAWTALGGWDRYEVFFVIMVLREIGPVHW